MRLDQKFGLRGAGYDFYRELDRGSFASVSLIGKKDDGFFAAKCSFDNGDSTKQIRNEAGLLKELRHVNVAQFIEYIEEVSVLVLQHYSGGDLVDLVSKRFLTPQEQLLLTQGLASALEYLHGQNILHRDIKPENILLSGSIVVKPQGMRSPGIATSSIASPAGVVLGDFGCAIRVASAPELTVSASYGGTIMFLPPEALGEIVEGERRYASFYGGDMWSLAMTLWIANQRQFPDYFYSGSQTMSDKAMEERIRKGMTPNLEKLPEGMAQILGSIFQHSVRWDGHKFEYVPGKQRMTAAELLKVLNKKGVELFMNSHQILHQNQMRALEAKGLSVVEKIGKGGFARVYSLKGDGSSGAVEECVAKCALTSGEGFRQIENEIAILEKLKHPNVIHFIGGIPELGIAVLARYTYDLFFFIQEGSGGVLDPGSLYYVVLGICRGLEYLHGRGIVHGDIKPENVLLAGDDLCYGEVGPKTRVALTDFGSAQSVPVGEIAVVKGIVGTPAYMSPEACSPKKSAAAGSLEFACYPGSDMWSFGVLLFIYASGSLPDYVGDKGIGDPDIVKRIAAGATPCFESLAQKALVAILRDIFICTVGVGEDGSFIFCPDKQQRPTALSLCRLLEDVGPRIFDVGARGRHGSGQNSTQKAQDEVFLGAFGQG